MVSGQSPSIGKNMMISWESTTFQYLLVYRSFPATTHGSTAGLAFFVETDREYLSAPVLAESKVA
jgi:hypothetical protein